MITRPMLAATVSYDDLDRVEWPVLCSPKVDGIRVLMHPELGPVTRSFKTLPNCYVCEELIRHAGRTYFDGELVAVDDNGKPLPFSQTMSAMMSRDGQPIWRYLVFDCFEKPEWDFATRHQHARHLCHRVGWPTIKILEHTVIEDMEAFIKYATNCLDWGFEGSIIRSKAGIYKNGRSTLQQGWLLKYKQWADAEGTIVGFRELMHNDNPDIRDSFDLAKRSSAKGNMVPMDTLGALIIETTWGEIRVGSGFDAYTRQEIWDRNITALGIENIEMGMSQPDIGRTITFKYQVFGVKDKPRFPIFKHFREEE